jgi:hypothetical protein
VVGWSGLGQTALLSVGKPATISSREGGGGRGLPVVAALEGTRE